NVVAREIEGEIIIVPLTAGVSDADDDLFTLNETGHAIWKLMDGEKTVKQIIDSLRTVYDAPAAEIQIDVTGLLAELLNRHIIAEKNV
ncbi:MAG: PqqD family protein, partial [Candidatus Aminicenantes bacterium]|nr:PqqD family protein [Candidatus Aminicenantes bacterium]